MKAEGRKREQVPGMVTARIHRAENLRSHLERQRRERERKREREREREREKEKGEREKTNN